MKRLTLCLSILLMSIMSTGIIGDNSPFTASSKKTTRKTVTKKSRYTKYTGTIGNYKVTVFLDSDANGYYYYGNGSNGKLTLRGVPEPSMNAAALGFYHIYEYNAKGERTAIWDVYIGSMAISPNERVKTVDGDMTTSDGRTYPVSLW